MIDLQLRVLPREFDPEKPSFRWRGQGPHLTQCVVGPHKCIPGKWNLSASNGLNKVRKKDRRQPNSYVIKKYVGLVIGGITFARATPPKNQLFTICAQYSKKGTPTLMVNDRMIWTLAV